MIQHVHHTQRRLEIELDKENESGYHGKGFSKMMSNKRGFRFVDVSPVSILT